MYEKTCTLYKKRKVFVDIPVHCTRIKRNSRTFHQKTKSVQNKESVQNKAVHNHVIAVHCTRNHPIFCTLYKNFCTSEYVWYLTHRKRICGSLWNIFWAFAACIHTHFGFTKRVSWRRVRKAVANSGEWNDLVKKAQANYSHTGWTCHCTHWVCQYCMYFYSLAISSGRTCYVKKMRVASARRNGRVGFRTSGRARTKFLKTTVHKCTRRKCTNECTGIAPFWTRMYNECTGILWWICSKTVQIMWPV